MSSIAELRIRLSQNPAPTTNQISPLQRVDSRLKQASAYVTFWGTRAVTIRNIVFSLDAIAQTVNREIKKMPHNYSAPTLTSEDQAAGFSIASRLKQLYAETDTLLKTANIFTRFLNFVREWFSSPESTARYYVDNNVWGSIKNLFNPDRTGIEFVLTPEEQKAAARRPAPAPLQA